MRPRSLPPLLVPVLLALPGIVLAVDGLFHPHHLTYDTSQRWYAIHLPGIVIFPLVGAALAWLVHGRRDPLAWIVRLAAYTYAVFYTSLDVISGVAAGYVTHRLGPDVPRPPAVSLLFRIGTPLGRVGEWALIVCCLAVLVDQVQRRGGLGLVAVVLLPGAWLVHTHHIFAPEGVIGMVLLGLTTAVLALDVGGRRETRWHADATSGHAGAS